MKKLTLTFLLLTLITPLYGADPKIETMLDRDEGIALFKQLLTDLNKGEMEKAFSHILDGGGSSFEIMSAKSIERLKKEDAKQFVSKNFPNYDLILRNFDQITFGKVESDKEKNPFKIKKDGKTLGEVQLFVIPIHMPFLKDSADNKNGSDGHGIYSRLKFVTFDGKTYWVPFGW